MELNMALYMGSQKKVWVLTLLVFTACTSKGVPQSDPKKLLSEYISKSFAVNSTGERAQLLTFLTGDAHRRLNAWSDDQFRTAFVESKRQFVKLAYQEIKAVGKDEVSITYELSYVDQNRGADAKITQRKLARIVRDPSQPQDYWRISDVRNLRELIEFRNEMALP